MSTVTPPAPAIHNAHCERARLTGCVCRCRGMLHQSDLLREAMKPQSTLAEYSEELKVVFGSPFTTLSGNPQGGERARRDWTEVKDCGRRRMKSQVEQRIVDVTLRDVLMHVHAVPLAKKAGWADFSRSLRGGEDWLSLSHAISTHSGLHDRHSGYFWSAMLAALAAAVDASEQLPRQIKSQKVIATISARRTAFAMARFPRARSGKNIQRITEMDSTAVVGLAAQRVGKAWSGSNLPLQERRLVLAVTGAALSADLWHQPGSCRYLLLPAVKHLRGMFGCGFSLDSATKSLEDVIDDELASSWRTGKAW